MNTPRYFEKPSTIWFPDFEEVMEEKEGSFQKYSFFSGIALIRYFRGELTREQFISEFLAQEMPQKILSREKELYKQIQEWFYAVQQQIMCPADFDAQIFLAFRNRPAEDVFVPALDKQEEICKLMSRLKQKDNRLPLSLFRIPWNPYLSGRFTRKECTELFLASGTYEYLARRVAYGIDKEDLAAKYRTEIAVCLRLWQLCLAQRDNSVSKDSFDTQFVALATEFCADIPE